ncbi:heterokaryon incompatibility protein-domain-containing protein [Aspergillus sergii]|uniref:Heterokaryon incompatibility protein-domain-containing protein n=1 Tax=Aspergillus sergii TaxID=1034303 RepID=A0A5N6XA80_9EURO|nr:heterokaryon incompatibility protein-domain-containing protein [Aspergillus sergii]
MSDHLSDYPLDPARREIRLLTILPSPQSEAPIECSLQVASLDAFPRYEAISYVWGDIQKKNDILLDGRTIQVPTNVRRILHRLRHRKQRRVIWIDYVCINQDNVAEKNTQVPLMGAIYANATSVIAIISLDNLSYNPTDAIAWMKVPDIERRKWKEECRRIKSGVNRVSVEHEKFLVVFVGNIACFYSNFLAAKYWTRMWTFQEYQLSQPKPPICICGDVEFPAHDESAFESASGMVLQCLGNMPRTAEERGPELRDLYEWIDRYSARLFDQVVVSGTTANHKWMSDKQDLSVLDFLRYTRDRKCQNPRDKIYALYGLLPSLREAYPPDYNKSLSQIIFETAKYILKEKGPDGLEMLDIFCLREDRLENVSIPSWVPDLTTSVLQSTSAGPRAAKEFHNMRFRLIRDQFWLTPPHEFTEDHSVLCISGWPIGKCRPVFQFASDAKCVLAQIMGVIQMRGDGRHLWDNVWEPENIPHRLLRACSYFVDKMFSPQYIEDPKFDLKRLRTVLETLDMIHQDADTVLGTLAEAGFGYIRDLVPKLYSIKVFTIHHTSHVSFGLSEHSVEEEDQVVIASVGLFQMPFILRQGYGTDHNNGQVYHKA